MKSARLNETAEYPYKIVGKIKAATKNNGADGSITHVASMEEDFAT
jgi:hypothetical protein